MSNNFMGVGGNSALSKNSTDGILNLLQLSLLGNNGGVNMNAAAAAPTSTISNMNSGMGPNSSNIMAGKANFYSQSVGASLSGINVTSIAGGVMTQQPIMSPSVSNCTHILAIYGFLAFNLSICISICSSFIFFFNGFKIIKK